MSRARDRISAAVEAKGYQVDCIEWRPIGGGVEMSGADGGWTVEATRGERFDHAFGYNVGEVLAFIEEFWEGPNGD